MKNWTKKSLVAAAAGALLIAGVGSALAGENGGTAASTSTATETADSVQIGEQVPWAIDADANAKTAAAEYREMIAQVRAAAQDLADQGSGKYLSVDVTLDDGSAAQVIVRADDFGITGWVDTESNEFFALNASSPNVLVGPPAIPGQPPRNNNNPPPANNQSNRNGNQNPPPPVPCVDGNGNRINQNNPQCANGAPNNARPPQRRDAGVRIANPLAATSADSAAEVKLSLDDLIGAITDLLDSDAGTTGLSEAINIIIQAITGGAASDTVEEAVSDALTGTTN